MKKISISIITGTCALLLLGSCKKESALLNPIPATSILDADAFTSPDRVLGLVNGIYGKIKDAQFYGGKYLMYQDFRGEEFINRTQNIFTGYDTWGHTLNSSSNEVQNLWIAAYSAINAANVFLKGLTINSSKLDAGLSKQYAGEAKLLRALSYFALVTLYARPYMADNGASPGLPLRLAAETSTTNNDLARSSVAEVYGQILKDLDEAELSLPLTYNNDLLNTTRVHRNTAIALKTRVYLNMGRYDKVMAEAARIVSITPPFRATTGVPHQLQPDITVVFSSNYTSSESIFSMPMTDLSSSTGQSALGYIFNAAPNGNAEYNLNPSGIIGNADWKSSDARRRFSKLTGSLSFLRKYDKPSPYTDFVPVIRYSEVLLNYAEALAQTGNLGSATELLNAVRKRSDPSYSFSSDKTDTQANLVGTIWVERRIEFLGEGFRSNDLLRNLLTIPAKGGSSLRAPAVGPNEAAYIFPLPNAEILTNKLLVGK